jgi:hypothetical protein
MKNIPRKLKSVSVEWVAIGTCYAPRLIPIYEAGEQGTDICAGADEQENDE